MFKKTLSLTNYFFTSISGREAKIRFTKGIKNNQPEKPVFLTLLYPTENIIKTSITRYMDSRYLSFGNSFEIKKATINVTNKLMIKKYQNSFKVASFLKLKMFLNAKK